MFTLLLNRIANSLQEIALFTLQLHVHPFRGHFALSCGSRSMLYCAAMNKFGCVFPPYRHFAVSKQCREKT